MKPEEIKELEKITKKFFKKRFPEKNIEFEKKTGYFYEWMTRFKTGNVENFMDEKSLWVWKEMQKEMKDGGIRK